MIVKNRFTGDEIGEFEIGPGADLRWADLRDADLRDANLRGANLRWVIGDGQIIKTIIASHYHVTWNNNIGVMAIGCEQHQIIEWQSFDDGRISIMASDALDWWGEWKQILIGLIEMLGGG